MRYRVLDSWRGIAALFVAAFHFPASGLIHSLPLVRHAYLFVDFFFVLSGFVIAHATRDGFSDGRSVAEFMTRRFGRVYPLYFAVLLAFLAIELFKLFGIGALGIPVDTVPFARDSYSDPSALVLHIGLLQAFGLSDGLSWNWPDWSIAAEFWTYLVFALVCWAVPKLRAAVLFGLALIALAIIAPLSHKGIELTYDFGFLRCLYGFSVGALAYEATREQRFQITGVMATTLEVLAVAVALAFVAYSGRNSTSFAAPLVFAATVLIFSREGGAVSRALGGPAWQRLGELSYSIYIIHALIVFIFGLAVSYAQHRGGTTIWAFEIDDGIRERVIANQSWLLLDGLTLGYLGLVVLLSILTYRYIEDPARRYFNARAATVCGRAGASVSV